MNNSARITLGVWRATCFAAKRSRNNFQVQRFSPSILQEQPRVSFHLDPRLYSGIAATTTADPSNSATEGLQSSTATAAATIATSEPKSQSQSQPDKLYKKIELEILGYESRVLDSYQWFVLTAARHLNLQVGKVWAPHTSDKFRFNLLASVHIFKKHQVHYEVRTYHRFINIHKLTGSTADTFLEYIQRNLPEGLGLKVTKVEVHPKPDFLERDKPETDQSS